MLGCTSQASVWIEWPLNDGRVCGCYCVDHGSEIGRSLMRHVKFVDLLDLGEADDSSRRQASS